MAQLENVLTCAAVMAALWTLIGLPFAVRAVPRSVAWYLAPTLGWAIHSVLAFPIFSVVGMARPTVLAVTAILLLVALAALWMRRATVPMSRPSALTILGLAGAILLAMAPMAAVLPKVTAEGIALAAPIFDHSKIALVDEMIRSGVPAANPFFSEVGTPDSVAYYYLWHFAAAVAAVMTGVSGWEADAALTGFTAFASLLLMMGVAVWISGRTLSAVIVLALAVTSSLRLPLDWLAGRDAVVAVIGGGSGFGGWLFQTSWAPQHTASAACVVLACLLLAQIAHRPGPFLAIIVGLLAAAGYQSSVWVGGLTFALAAAAITLRCLWPLELKRNMSFLGYAALAAAVAAALSAPFFYDQLVMAGLRAGGSPVVLRPVEVLGDGISLGIRRILDLPAYWLVYLPVELPACYPAGMAVVLVLLARRSITDSGGPPLRSLVLLLATSLVVAWLLASVVGINNDLGWRAVLPGVLLLTALAAAGASGWLTTGPRTVAVLAAAGTLLGLPEGYVTVKENVVGLPAKSERVFATTPALWSAVRRHMTPAERLANDPQFLADMTPWPINISWALLANRRSCYASAELALPFAPIPRARRAAIEAQFTRIFAGEPEPGDVAQLANRYNCDVIVVTAQDGAWARDPFASTEFYRLVESRPDAWRIYKRGAGERP